MEGAGEDLVLALLLLAIESLSRASMQEHNAFAASKLRGIPLLEAVSFLLSVVAQDFPHSSTALSRNGSDSGSRQVCRRTSGHTASQETSIASRVGALSSCSVPFWVCLSVGHSLIRPGKAL